MARAGLTLAAALLLMLAAMTVKGVLIALPEPPDAPQAGRFDADRAMARLARMLGDQRAHPVDSDAADAVRERLIAEMRAVGLNPAVRDSFTCNGFARFRTVACARVRNVVATLPRSDRRRPGSSDGRHLLLSAHYDSTFAGPGAADAGIGVATLLEVAAQLRGRPLNRPVTFLFNEGEEMGLLGARAFLDQDPLAPRVDALLNFEARGVTGPATMFETSRPNGAALGRFARVADRPVANSLTTNLYRLIPNSTDVAVFGDRPWTILNFAVIGNETRYHSPGDDLAALDRRSLQHMGDQGLALALDFATRDAPAAGGELLYGDLAGRQLLTLPQLPGLIALGILLVFFLVVALRRSALGRPLGAMAVSVVGGGGVAWVGQALLALVRDGDYWRGHPWVTELFVYGAALGTCLAMIALIAGGTDRRRLRAAFWLMFVAGGAAIAVAAPGAAIFFLLPPLAMALGMVLAPRWRAAEAAGAWTAALLLFLSFAPALHLFEELMNGGPHWMFAPIGAVMLLPALIELRRLIIATPALLVFAGAGDLFLLPWIAAALTPAHSADRKQHFTIEHVWDADAGTARWAVNNDGAAVPFAADWQRVELPYSLRKRWAAPAPGPAVAVTPPAVELAGEQPVRGGRRLRLRLRLNGAEALSIVAPEDAALRGAGVGARLQPFGTGGVDPRYVLRCTGRSCDGAVIDLVVGRPGPVELTLIGTRTGLPASAAPLVRARPALAQPQYAPDSTITLSKVRF